MNRAFDRAKSLQASPHHHAATSAAREDDPNAWCHHCPHSKCLVWPELCSCPAGARNRGGVAILEDGAFLLTHPWICCGVQSNARNSPCHSQGQKQHHTFPSLLPHQEHFMHTELGSSALPHLPFFSFSICKSQQEFPDIWVSRSLWLSLQVPALLPAH